MGGWVNYLVVGVEWKLMVRGWYLEVLGERLVEWFCVGEIVI